MIDPLLNWAAACRRVGSLRAQFRDEVRPCDHPPPPHCPYHPAYGWMFTYERRLRGHLREAWGAAPAARWHWLFGEGGPVSEALSNAYVHGHRRNPELPITVAGAVGEGGLALAITDVGPGFPVVAHVERARRGKVYFRQAGNGLKVLVHDPRVLVNWELGGRRCLLLFPLNPETAPPAPAGPPPSG